VGSRGPADPVDPNDDNRRGYVADRQDGIGPGARDAEPNSARRVVELRGRGRILIVEDEPLVSGLLRDILTTMADEVATAASGAAALDVVPIFQPDVILTDMIMPGMSGPDLLVALRQAGVTVPVILMSGQITMSEGFFGLVEKPFDLQKLAQVVTAALNQGRTERA
jgi:DNA-binding NtrC family response regulator